MVVLSPKEHFVPHISDALSSYIHSQFICKCRDIQFNELVTISHQDLHLIFVVQEKENKDESYFIFQVFNRIRGYSFVCVSMCDI